MTDPKWRTWALDQARRDLIDLTRRNRLLHAPLGGNRLWCTAITGHTPDQLFERLYRQENFRGYAFKAYEEESSELQPLDIVAPDQIIRSGEAAPTRRLRLQTRLDRLGSAREVAQIGAAIGREFSYALMAAVARKV